MKAYVALFALKHRVKGLENLPPGAKILAANHPNISDAFQLPLLLEDRLTIVAQASQFRAIVLGWILTHSGAIPVHNGRGREAFELSCQALREGKTVLIFPEGGNVTPGRRARARHGWDGHVGPPGDSPTKNPCPRWARVFSCARVPIRGAACTRCSSP